MHTRREVLRGGIGIMGLGAIGPYLSTSLGSTLVNPETAKRASVTTRISGMPTGLKATRPLAPRSFDPEPRMIDGFRFKSWFEGDDFTDQDIPFHSQQNNFPNGNPPEPTEEIDLAIIGGGISGLTSAYLLRDHNPVVFELHDRFQRAGRHTQRRPLLARQRVHHHARQRIVARHYLSRSWVQ